MLLVPPPKAALAIMLLACVFFCVEFITLRDTRYGEPSLSSLGGTSADLFESTDIVVLAIESCSSFPMGMHIKHGYHEM